MASVTVEIPDDLLAKLRNEHGEPDETLRRVAAFFLCSRGELSTSQAARLAGMTYADFLEAAAHAKVWRLGGWRVPVGLAVLAVVGNAVALPLYSLVWRAGRVGGSAILGRPPRWSAAGLLGTLRLAWDESAEPLAQSLMLSALGAAVSVVLAWSLAWAGRRSAFWRAVAAAAFVVALAIRGRGADDVPRQRRGDRGGNRARSRH